MTPQRILLVSAHPQPLADLLAGAGREFVRATATDAALAGHAAAPCALALIEEGAAIDGLALLRSLRACEPAPLCVLLLPAGAVARELEPPDIRPAVQPAKTRALSNKRRHGPSSPQPGGDQACCTLRTTRSGCGIRIVTRPSAEHSPAMPSGEPFGLAG